MWPQKKHFIQNPKGAVCNLLLVIFQSDQKFQTEFRGIEAEKQFVGVLDKRKVSIYTHERKTTGSILAFSNCFLNKTVPVLLRKPNGDTLLKNAY